MGKPEIAALAKEKTGRAVRTRDAASKQIWNRHRSLIVFKAKSRATAGAARRETFSAKSMQGRPLWPPLLARPRQRKPGEQQPQEEAAMKARSRQGMLTKPCW